MFSKDLLGQQIVDACQQLNRRQFVANHDGNITVRLTENRFLATPTSFAKRTITAADLLEVDGDGKVLEGPHRLFSEWKVHRAIYEILPDCSCVVHAHPPYAMAWGLAQKQYGYGSIPEAIVSLGGPLRTVERLLPSAAQPEIKGTLMEAIQNCYAVVIPGNGVFAIGDDPEMAYLRLELVEQIVRAQALALQLGAVEPLRASDVNELLTKRPSLKAKWRDSATTANAVSSTGPTPELAKNTFAVTSRDLSPDRVRDIIRSEITRLLKA